MGEKWAFVIFRSLGSGWDNFAIGLMACLKCLSPNFSSCRLQIGNCMWFLQCMKMSLSSRYCRTSSIEEFLGGNKAEQKNAE